MYYETKKEQCVEISAAYKNFLKNDTSYYEQLFLYHNGSDKIAKLFYGDNTGFSIYKNATTYYVYTYNNTYYVGENSSDGHLKFLPYWDPSSFFKKYLTAGKVNAVNVEHNEKERYYALFFSNKKDWRSILYVSDDNYSITRYSEIYIHKKFGTQFKEYKMEERSVMETSDEILKELDTVTNSYIHTTDKKIKEGLEEHERLRAGLIQSKINKAKLIQILSGKNYETYSRQYILLDYFYQTCFPCLKSIPELNDLRNEFDTSKLLIVGVDPLPMDAGHKEKFIQRYNVTYPVFDGGEASEIKKISLPGLGVHYPTLVLIKPDGTIEYIMEQYSKNHVKVLRSYLKKVSSEN
ncbi:MAG TPA: TlpA disulfide reductase family protein [Chitinophagaceae bacterium]|nr:TlpA disulfide reductase family protein [Chitinophagaceae bacterium]